MKNIMIVDFAGGNLNVLRKKIRDFGFDIEYSNHPTDIEKASLLILPGVGHFKSAMSNLKKSNLIDILNQKVLVDKIPVIGICLGMQLFSEYSEEGCCDGLGWIKSRTQLLKFNDKSIKVPNIGWCSLSPNDENKFYDETDIKHKYYFIHSYHVVCNFHKNVMSYTEYGGEKFCSSIIHENIMGFQFHPEKSHKTGIKLLIKAINKQFKQYGV